MCEARGKKETMYLASVVNIIGEALEAGSVNISMFLVSRFIAGWGIGISDDGGTYSNLSSRNL
jgi:predicted MFS family arabinose efflux permease